MAQVYAMPATVPARSPGPGCEYLRPEVPVVVLDEAMLASGFLALRSAVAALLRSGASTLVVDVSALDRLSSSTVSALLWAQRRCRTGAGAIVLIPVDPKAVAPVVKSLNEQDVSVIAVATYRDRTVFLFFLTNDKHIRHFLNFCLTYFPAYCLVSVIYEGANFVIFQQF